MLTISFKVPVRPSRNSNACTHTQKTHLPQASNGTDSGLKFRKRITCKIAFPCNDLDQFWLNFVENDHIFPANARKNSWFSDQNVGNQEQWEFPSLSWFTFSLDLKLPLVNYFFGLFAFCVDEHCLTNSIQEFIIFWARMPPRSKNFSTLII